jgi:hypothetical protein
MRNGVLTLMEVANAYYSRVLELIELIQRAETEGYVTRGSHMYKLRTGELRTFADLSKAAIDLGSRRVTYAQVQAEMKHG